MIVISRSFAKIFIEKIRIEPPEDVTGKFSISILLFSSSLFSFMIRALNLDSNSENVVTIDTLGAIPLKNTWLEVVDPTAEELVAVCEKTGIPSQFLRVPVGEGKINLRFEPDFTIVDFVTVRRIVTSREVSPIVLAFSKNFLVTVAKKADEYIFNVAKQRMSKTKIDPPAHVVYFILDEVVNNYFVRIEKIEEYTSHLEEEVVGKANPNVLKKILKQKSRLILFNKVLWYERGVVFKLKTCSDNCMPARIRNLFETTHEDLTRQIDIIETYREIMSDAINVHLSAVSNKINFSIQSLTIIIFYLTIITTITSFPNTIATFFGISQFGNSPVLIILVAIVLSTILPVLWLWRKRWLKYDLKEPVPQQK